MWMGRPHLRERNVWQPVMVMVSLDSTEIAVDFRLESRIVKEFFGRRSFWTLRVQSGQTPDRFPVSPGGVKRETA